MYNLNSMEKITAQNSTNQSKNYKYFNCLTEEMLDALAKNVDSVNKENYFETVDESTGLKETPVQISGSIIAHFLKQADRIISKARLSEGNKGYVKCAFECMKMLIPNDWFSVDFEHIAENYYPEDLLNAVNNLGTEDEELTKEEILECTNEEIGNILGDFFSARNNGVPYKDWESVKDGVLRDYYMVYEELGEEVPEWIKRDMKELHEMYK